MEEGVEQLNIQSQAVTKDLDLKISDDLWEDRIAQKDRIQATDPDDVAKWATVIDSVKIQIDGVNNKEAEKEGI